MKTSPGHTIKDAMSRVSRLFPSGYWQTYFIDRFYTADTKAGLRQFLSHVRATSSKEAGK